MACKKHKCECKHENVRYCNNCKVVHCDGCNMEWVIRNTYYSPQITYTYATDTNELTPYYLNKFGQNTLTTGTASLETKCEHKS